MDAVREEGKKARREIEAKNPELKLKHDPTQILPKVRGLNGHHFRHLHWPFNFRERAADGLPYVGVLNRGLAHIQMAVRLAGEVNVPKAFTLYQEPPKHSSKSEPR